MKRRTAIIVDSLQTVLLKLDRLKAKALENKTEIARDAYTTVYLDFERLCEQLVEEAHVERWDLELLSVKSWIPRPPKSKRVIVSRS